MRISNYKNNQPAFGVNLSSPKLKLSNKDFYIRIRGYGKNSNWAEEIKKTTNKAVGMIRKNWSIETVLINIAEGVKDANMYVLDSHLRANTGVLRNCRDGWECVNPENIFNNVIVTPYNNNKYKSYEKRLDERKSNPINNPFSNIGLARIDFSKIIREKCIYHPSPFYLNDVFSHIEKIYSFIQENFIKKEIKPEEISIANEKIAEIRWVLAHSMPWLRGTDSISNSLMRAIYKAMGVKTYPAAKGVSFDLEAFCTNLEDYKKNFANLFEKPPEVIE